ncbi:MAG: AsmA family protein [Alphaproteobacteria bacterium]|nr:AsmA family protein [Alphaproteobacteria bacterium]
MRFVGGLIALVVLLVAIAFMAAALVPASAYKDKIEAAASERTGRTVTLGDDISFQVFPRIGFHVSSLSVANPEGFTTDAFVTVEEADLGVDLLALARGEVAIERFVLTRPIINLERRADGAGNWVLGAAAPDDASSDDSGTDGSVGADAVRDVRLGDVRIIDGAVAYADAATAARYAATAVDATARLDSLSAPFEADGAMTFQGAPSTFNLIVTTLANLRDGEPANVKLDMTAGESRIGADIKVSASENGSTFEGPLSIDAPDLPALAALFDAPLEDAPGFDSLSASGDAAGDANAVTFKNLDIRLDAIDASGEMTLRLDGARPKAIGALRTGSLDLRPYLPPPGEKPAGGAAWSDAKLNLNSLRNVDAELELAADQILLNGIETGKSRLAINLAGGRLTADLPQLQVYDGGGSGRIIVDASGAAPRMQGYFDLRAVQAQPLTQDLLSTDRLLGIGAFRIEFTARGDSQAAIMNSLDGEGGFDLADGALKGVNIAKLVGSVRDVVEGGSLAPAALTSIVSAARSPNEATDFTEFLSAFKMDNGLVRASEIAMNGPFLRMTGSGLVDLPKQTLDIRLAPRVTETIDGAEGRAFTAPMRITGSMFAPQIAVDAEALLTDKVKDQGRQLLEKALGLDTPPPSGDAAAADGAKPKPAEDAAKSLLRGILGSGAKKPAEETPPEGDTPEDD